MKHNNVWPMKTDDINLRCPSCNGLNTHQHNVRVDDNSIKVDFDCESCGDVATLVIYQHQGETRMGWYNG